jgi:hypothetical protein
MIECDPEVDNFAAERLNIFRKPDIVNDDIKVQHTEINYRGIIRKKKI